MPWRDWFGSWLARLGLGCHEPLWVLKSRLAGLAGETIVFGLGLIRGPWADGNKSKNSFQQSPIPLDHGCGPPEMRIESESPFN